MAVQLIITDAGRAAIINDTNNGTHATVIAEMGVSPTNAAFTTTTTVLPNETKRISNISGEAVESDLIHLSFIDQSNDTYTVRAIAAYLANGVLFAIGGTADPITEKVAGSDSMISVDIKLVDIDGAQITFGNTNISNPPATTNRQGVIRIATPLQALDGIAQDLAIVPATMKAYIDAKIAEGIDAAMLGGQLPAFYANINARLGYTAANAADLANVWRSTNDGSGSGLDADLLDGHDAAEFALASDFLSTKLESGVQHLPGGLILQWCRGVTDNPGNYNSQFIAFPIQFPTACIHAQNTTEAASGFSHCNTWYQNIGQPTLAGVSVRRKHAEGEYDQTATTPLIFAIGH